ncbi:hypothetical protein NEDG_01982 [Nematocida displodere]|uniref:Uncharacterized protein n=1 Tax=Nematocida displodere TaxID=1805483 RepID=A0A177EGA4_9MICR|nr:hypothetical protein NEDG_01982 [Nematocida displodere]
MYPPLFFEETVSFPEGDLFLKVFVDRDHSITHVLAMQPCNSTNHTSRLAHCLKGVFPTKKTSVMCYVSAQSTVDAIITTIARYASSIPVV